MVAQLDVLTAGYVGDRVASTVVLVRDGDAIVVVDPGMVASRGRILDPMRALAVQPEAVTDVVFSHHHPDHTINAALFPNARYHDFWAVYVDDVWTTRMVADHPDGWPLSSSIRLHASPGHSAQDISTVVQTEAGIVVCTHAWWHEGGPAIDPYADAGQLTASRARLLELQPTLIVPGHGPAFPPGPATPR